MNIWSRVKLLIHGRRRVDWRWRMAFRCSVQLVACKFMECLSFISQNLSCKKSAIYFFCKLIFIVFVIYCVSSFLLHKI